MTQIVWTNAAGEIALTTLIDADDHKAEAARLLESGLVPEGWAVNHVRPDDRHFAVSEPEFFGAHVVSGGEIAIDMVKAADIWRDRIRAARASALAALDSEWQRAMERGEDTNGIAFRKQVLRDAPQAAEISAAKTTTALRATWPASLPRQRG